jgi:hypothetical protein
MTGLGDLLGASKGAQPSITSPEEVDMAFSPLEQTGIPVDEQFRNWSELIVTPFDKDTVDPYTRTRVILMNGIEGRVDPVLPPIRPPHRQSRAQAGPGLAAASKPTSKGPSTASTPATRHPWKPRSATNR